LRAPSSSGAAEISTGRTASVSALHSATSGPSSLRVVEVVVWPFAVGDVVMQPYNCAKGGAGRSLSTCGRGVTSTTNSDSGWQDCGGKRPRCASAHSSAGAGGLAGRARADLQLRLRHGRRASCPNADRGRMARGERPLAGRGPACARRPPSGSACEGSEYPMTRRRARHWVGSAPREARASVIMHRFFVNPQFKRIC
jgi:hypothetical protein